MLVKQWGTKTETWVLISLFKLESCSIVLLLKIPFMSKIVFMIRILGILGTPAHKSKTTFAKMFLQN